MRVRKLLVAALTTSLIAAMGPAQAAQMTASEPPTVTGALALERSKCDRGARRFEGNVVARARVCLFLYRFDPAGEDDEAKDYRVLWAQSNVNAVEGWCVSKVHTDIVIPAGTEHATPVPAEQTFEEKATFTTELTATAGDTAKAPAGLSKQMTVYPGTLAPAQQTAAASGSEEPTHEVVRLTWVGKSDNKLGFATGFEIAQTTGSKAPAVSFSVRYPVKQTTC